MYQASEVGRCAPGRHEYPRASENSLPERPPRAELVPNSANARGLAPLQSSTDSLVISPTAMAGGNTGFVLCQVGGQ